MISKSQKISFLFIKKNKIESTPSTKQTEKIRNSTNLKIRELGDKYYVVKNILEKLNIKRDTLFFYGKKLELEYKNQKKGIHLYTQKRRMKESIICWYAEHFYNEITQLNSVFLENLVLFNSLHNNQAINNSYIKNKKKPKNNNRKAINLINDNIRTDILPNNENDSMSTNIEMIDTLPNEPENNENIEIEKHFLYKEKNTNESLPFDIQANQNGQMHNDLNQSMQSIQNSDQNQFQNSPNICMPNVDSIKNNLLFKGITMNQETDYFEYGNFDS